MNTFDSAVESSEQRSMACFKSVVSILLIIFMASIGQAENLELAHNDDIDLTEWSLEDLMEIEVTSVSKKTQKLSDAAAAIFVITANDIRRSGVTSIPEALRMVPGLEVAHIDASKWAVTSRGFNGRFANKLLVLIDGRSVYTPVFSGVYWDVQDTLLEDIERIEIIRGPGAALWGANAVNGVINIITKSARDTQGGLVTAGAGTEEKGFGGIRYGGKTNNDLNYRVYAKYFNRDHAVYASGDDAADQWDLMRGGFRMDWESSESDLLTFQGDIHDGDFADTITVPLLTAPYSKTFNSKYDQFEANLLGRWTRTFSDSSEMVLQSYYDRVERDTEIHDIVRQVLDLDFQHRFAFFNNQEVVWGWGYRYIRDEIENTEVLIYEPRNRHDGILNAFAQDEITLVEDVLRLTFGLKFEHNDYTGAEFQPNARLLWAFHPEHTLWAVVSRAVRTPSRSAHDSRINSSVYPPGFLYPGSPATLVALMSDRDYRSEVLYAFELGYRFKPMDELSFDLATFYNDYDHLRTFDAGLPTLELSPSPAHLLLPMTIGNRMKGEVYGAELAVDWRATSRWSFQTSYSFLQMQLHMDSSSTDSITEAKEGNSPHHQVSLRSTYDLSRETELNFWVRYVDDLPSQNIEEYLTLDVRLAWKPHQNLELALVGQNLLDNQHMQYVSEIMNVTSTEVERSYYAKITWEF